MTALLKNGSDWFCNCGIWCKSGMHQYRSLNTVPNFSRFFFLLLWKKKLRGTCIRRNCIVGCDHVTLEIQDYTVCHSSILHPTRSVSELEKRMPEIEVEMASVKKELQQTHQAEAKLDEEVRSSFRISSRHRFGNWGQTLTFLGQPSQSQGGGNAELHGIFQES